MNKRPKVNLKIQIKFKEEQEASCKICLDKNDPSDIIHPCKCQGSIYYVHQSCLKKWILSHNTEIDKAQCELCHYQYEMSYSIGLVCNMSSETCVWNSQSSMILKLLALFVVLMIAFSFTLDYVVNEDNSFVFVICVVLILFILVVLAGTVAVIAKNLWCVKKLKGWKILPYTGENAEIFESPIAIERTELLVPRTIIANGIEVMTPMFPTNKIRKYKTEIKRSGSKHDNWKRHKYNSQEWEESHKLNDSPN